MCAHEIISLELHLHHLLVLTTTANQAALPSIGQVDNFQTTSYGMESSVVLKVHVALVPTLRRGSVSTSIALQVMILKCAFVVQKAPRMKTLQLNY